ncbi:hypothetical protein [Microbacterium sp. ZXX196]|uniref:hypothetical protein n=1 Tax=Microbacterium sp. ZXX196 TaxID=2609291 RepID=UPI0012B6AD4C|nr:hypothetical protein [Microbacterium sp. ZXX196]MTE24045.1 hypothetical protein [Microbacterium sp. ZXX196]
MPPLAFRPGLALSVAEISACRLDGDLVPVARDAYAPRGVPASPAVRASALDGWLPPGCVAVGVTAAWIHGLLPGEPPRHHAQALEGRTPRRTWRGDLVIHEWPLPAGDVVRLGGIAVSSFPRTWYDLARRAYGDPSDREARTALDACADRAEGARETLAWLADKRGLRFTARLRGDIERALRRR